MTKIIGLTGGIGSGKTTVSEMFRELGVPVYIADEAARRITAQPEVQQLIASTFGSEIAEADGTINRKKLAGIVFSDPNRLKMLNDIVHPLVKRDFQKWLSQQKAPFVIREAAILFESGTNIDCDQVITVTAPLELRISRVMERDQTTRAEVMTRMANQWPESQKIALSDYVITNAELAETRRQTERIFTELTRL